MSKKDKKGRSTKKTSALKKQIRVDKAMRQVEPVVVPLCELFAVADDVFTEEGAFSQEHIKKSLGRLHRQWKKTRAALDPEFDPKDYERRPKTVGEGSSQSPLAMALRQPSTDQSPTSERNQKKTAKPEKRSASRSATPAKSGGRASRGR